MNLDYHRIKELLAPSTKVVITTHRSPDGDAIGSSLGLYHFLILNELEVNVIIPDADPEFLHWMAGHELITVFESDQEKSITLINNADVIFSLDYNRLDRIAEMGSWVEKASAKKILIDHHIDPATYFDFSLSDTSASSTAELVFRFVDSLGWKSLLNKDIAECLYSGIMTDTGSFKFSSTSAYTHRVVADLMDVGLVPDRVHNAIFDNSSFDRLQLVGYALSNKFEFDAERGVSIIGISLNEKNRFKYQKGDTEGLVNYGLSVKGAKMAVFLSEELNFTKFSFRSKGQIDVNKIARAYFNGGGHKNAAGGRLDMPLKESINFLKDVIQNKITL